MTSRMDRRTFLQGSSVAALCAVAGSEVGGVADAAPAPLLSSNNTVAQQPAYAAAKFNGGRSQVNFNFLQTGGDFPFLNVLKTAQNWSFLDNSGWPEPSTLDSDGYPTVITNKGVYTVCFVPSQAVRPGNYVITWSGNGTIHCGMNNTPVSGSKTSINGAGRYVFATTDTRFVIGISAIGNPRISNLQVFHADDEAALKAGQVFGVQFKRRLVEANFGVLRFLNWQSANTTNVTTWATRKPISYVFYAGHEFRPDLYAGITTNNGTAYSAALPNCKLVDKATVIVKFNASNSGPCTLNINNTGAVNILSETASALGTYTSVIGAGWQSYATLVYDADLKAWIKHGADVAYNSMGLNNGCPPELMVRLCAEIGAHPYFVAPHLSVDPMTDYMSSLAAYCRDNSPSWMIPRFEGPNELWNTAAGFFATGYAKAKANSYGWGQDYQNWYGKAISILGQAISHTYGGNRSRYQVLCGVQTPVGQNAYGTAGCNDRLASTKFLAQSAPAQTPYAKSAASKWVTHVCIAIYYNPAEQGTAQEAADAANFAAALDAKDVARQTSIANAYANTAKLSLPYAAAVYAQWKLWAKGFGISKICAYEGGYSPDLNSTPQINALRAASKQAPALTDFTLTNYNSFVGLSDSNFSAEFPSCFQLSNTTSSKNAWSVLDDIFQVSSPQWKAIVSFNHS